MTCYVTIVKTVYSWQGLDNGTEKKPQTQTHTYMKTWYDSYNWKLGRQKWTIQYMVVGKSFIPKGKEWKWIPTSPYTIWNEPLPYYTQTSIPDGLRT